jgi:hypothetical protein
MSLRLLLTPSLNVLRLKRRRKANASVCHARGFGRSVWNLAEWWHRLIHGIALCRERIEQAVQKTFPSIFRQPSLDEGRYIREVGRKYGTEHFDRELGPDLDLRAIENIAFYSDEPSVDAGALS